MLLETTIKFVGEYTEVKELCVREFASDMLSMNPDEFVLMTKLMRLLDTSLDLVREQAETIDSINQKLDRLLEK